MQFNNTYVPDKSTNLLVITKNIYEIKKLTRVNTGLKYTNIRSKTRVISTSVIFSVLAIVLHPPFFPLAIPAPYAPFLIL